MKSLIIPPKQSAFTLLEMLIVVLIIGLLVGISVPALLNSKSDSVDAQENGNLSVLSTAVARAHLDSAVAIPEIEGSDVGAATTWLFTHGYIGQK